MREILGAALEVSPADRTEFLATACGTDHDLRKEIEALLAFSDDEGFIDTPAIAQGVALIDLNDAESMVGRTVGRYRVLQLIGEGGVGAVYRAARADDDYEQQLALKLLKRGMDSAAILRRFRDERRILARLDHPNIARFLDGGIADDGRPYFVMEFLEGTPIHVYCRTHELTVRERLELFLSVCAAVEYSHRNLVIHRDLKASNILVTEDRVPKLLDYGIAKLLDRDTSETPDVTQAADRMLTPDYASPEQIRGEVITTAADVYSLGVLLYELLADRRPFQLAGLSSVEMHRLITEVDPPKASSVAPPERKAEIAGDLDTVLQKAMHRSADRRYPSAQSFADDIRRYLDGLPVTARPDTFGYRLGKFVRRNRASVAVAALSSVLLFGAAFTAVYQNAVAQSKDREARKRFSEIRELASGLLGDVDAALESLPGSTAARELLARKVLHYLDGLARAEVRDVTLQRDLASAYDRLGDIVGGTKASNLGNTTAALDSYRKALVILNRAGQYAPSDLTLLRARARAYSKLSDVLALTGDHAKAIEHEREALQLRMQWEAAAPDDPAAKRAVAVSLQEIAGDLDRFGRFEEALKNRGRVLEIMEQVAASGVSDNNFRLNLSLAHRHYGRSLARLRRFPEALASMERALAIERDALARNPVRVGNRTAVAYTLFDIGGLLTKMGDAKRALPLLAEAVQMRLELADADPKDWRAASLLASARLQHGRTLIALGRWVEGVTNIRQSLEARKELSARNPKNSGARGEVAEASAALADALAERRLWADALPLYEAASAIYDDMKSKGSLTMELAEEPARVAGALVAARKAAGAAVVGRRS